MNGKYGPIRLTSAYLGASISNWLLSDAGVRFILFLEEYELMAADNVIGLARRGPTFVSKIVLPTED
jgi:hypothetical protein